MSSLFRINKQDDIMTTNKAILDELEKRFHHLKEVTHKQTVDSEGEEKERINFENVELTDFEPGLLRKLPEMKYAYGSKVDLQKGNQYYLLTDETVHTVRENYTKRHHGQHDGRSSGSGETILESIHRHEADENIEAVVEVKRGIHGRHKTHGRKIIFHHIYDNGREEIKRSIQNAIEEARDLIDA